MVFRILTSLVITYILSLASIAVHGQDSIVINHYAKVIKVLNAESLKVDSLVIESNSNFKAGDTVLIHQAKGARWNYSSDKPAFSGTGFTGRFEVHIIGSKKGDTLILRSTLNSKVASQNYDPNEVLQVVKIPSVKYFKNSKTITSKAFDGVTGGILALIADTVDLGANIDVSGKGFRGGNPEYEQSLGLCAFGADSLNFKKGYYSYEAIDSSGLKGESLVSYINQYRRGRIPIGNGGGGGNGFHSGGGGGSCFGRGGTGGAESEYCSALFTNIGGVGGISLNNTDFFRKFTLKPGLSVYGYLDTIPYAVFGGGGGASTKSEGYTASLGGNGGGIAIIITNVIKGNGFSIISNGQDVTLGSQTGGGGGGGGGALLLDCDVIGNLFVYAKGGKGGNTIVPNENTGSAGPGGGGGGGYILHKGDTLLASCFTSFGLSGRTPEGKTHASSPGGNGITLGRLIIPLKGFLYNLMSPDQEICAGETPKLFNASEPKGGTKYRFLWRKSQNRITWDSVSNTLAYQSGPLFDTTYFQRIVSSLVLVNGKDSVVTTDTSSILVVNVLPAILNNSISSDTFEICKGKSMPYIFGTSVTGGNGSYTYHWQDSVTSWADAPGTNNLLYYKPSHTDSSRFRRVVKSGVCTNYSNTVKIDVLPTIKGNYFGYSRYVEMGRIAENFVSDAIRGGKENYTYLWEQSADQLNWAPANGLNASLTYILPKLNDTLHYRRTIYSGQLNTCTSISDTATVFVLDSVVNNSITGTVIMCSETAPKQDFVGTQPNGGDATYKYLWEVSADKLVWDTSAIVTNLSFNPGRIDNDCFYRRIVLSGPNDCCKDTSNIITITTRPAIRDFELLKTDTVICFNQTAGIINAKQPINGDGPYTYQWYASKNSSSWALASGVSNLLNYNTGNLTDSVKYFRKIISGVCEAYSDTLSIGVLPLIANNILEQPNDVCYGLHPDTIKSKTLLGGAGNYIYQWFESTDNVTWNLVSSNGSELHYQPEPLYTPKYYKRSVSSGLNNCCKDTSLSVQISVNQLPKITMQSFNDSICLGESFDMNFTISGKIPFKLQLNDGFSTSLKNDITTLDYIHSITPNIPNVYNYNIVELIDGNNCIAETKSISGKLSVFEIPKVILGPDTAACGTEMPLKAFSGVGKGQWSTNIPVEFMPNDSALEVVAKIDELHYGPQSFKYTLNNGGCVDSARVEVIYYQPPLDPSVGENIEGPFLFKTPLKAYLPLLGTGYWTALDNSIIIENPGDPLSIADGLKFGKNQFVWYVENGLCIAASDTFTVTVNDIKVPNGFSPNNDKINDYFEIRGLEYAPNASLVIINKWGKEVYKSSDYKNNWEGNSLSGNPLPSDTYYYMLNVIDRVYKGYVVIRR